MKKGFTLVEIIGVIILLGIISLIIVPITNISIKNSKESALKEKIKLIETAAQKWSFDNINILDENDYYLSIDTLINTGYLKNDEKTVKNPVDDSNMTGCVLISYETDYNQYTYNYVDYCN